MIRNAWHISGGKGAHENSTNLRVLCLYKDKTEEVVVVQSDMGLGDERAKNYKDKVIAWYENIFVQERLKDMRG